VAVDALAPIDRATLAYVAVALAFNLARGPRTWPAIVFLPLALLAVALVAAVLAPRGRRAAPAIGIYLRDHKLIPDLVLVSTAQRTRETWELINLMFAEAPTVRYDDKLYLADADDILKRIAKAPAAAETVMVVGHNPGLQELAVALFGGGEAIDFNRLKAKFPTGGLAIYEFDVDRWSNLRVKSGRLVGFTAPRDLV